MSPTTVSQADCTPKCRSCRHTSELTSALVSGAAEQSVLAWVARHCHNPARTKDTSGRSLVHVAAAAGQIDVLDWVLQCKDGSLNGKDSESGYSPLHRAMFHGQVKTVVHLIQLGANLALLDHDGLSALDHAVLDRPLHVSYDLNAPLDAYVWGVNSNFNLGLGNNTNRSLPDIVESFRKDNTNISKVCLQKFHSAFITRSGQVMTCGHGRGGRLGHGSETMQLVPKTVQLPSLCLDVSLGVDHSLFLCEGGTVYSCGVNTFHQLGHFPPPPLLLAPAPITARSHAPKYPPAVGVAAARFHSLFWTTDSVFTWGLNAGQLGHIKGDKTILQPKLVSSLSGRDKISTVVVSDGASVVLTAKGDILALHEYGTKKLGQRQHNIVRMTVNGGHLDPGAGHSTDDIDYKLVAGGGSVLRVMLLSKTGKISIWEDNRENNFIPCLFNVNKDINVTDVGLHKSGLIIVTAAGEAWTGTHQAGGQSTKTKGGVVRDIIKIKRLSNIHRAVSVACDAKGKNFCVLQVCPNEALTEIPEVSPSTMKQNMKTLLNEVNLQDDLHDVVCILGKKKYPAHGFVLASGSESFAKQLKFLSEDHDEDLDVVTPVTIEVNDVLPDIFEQILQYLYYKTCDLLVEGKCPIVIEEPKQNNKQKQEVLEVKGNPKEVSAFSVYSDNKKKKKNSKSKSEQEALIKAKSNNPLSHLQEAAKQLGVYGLVKIVDCFKFSEGIISRKSSPPSSKLDFCSKNYPELQDVTIVCDNNEEVYAHKCVLVSRSEYFFSMFSSSWSESSSQLSLPLEANIVQTVIDYLYTDDSARVVKSEDVEFVSNILVVADQFLLNRLKEICECQLSRLLTLKNVAELFQFSVYYLSSQLQQSSMQFICLNLPALLESRTLEILDDVSWDKLDDFYRNSNPVFRNRRLTPLLDYPRSENIETEFLASPITLEELKVAEEMAKLNLKSRRRRTSSGEKNFEKSRSRLNSSESYSEESGNESDNEDKMSFKDFEIEERKEEEQDENVRESPEKEPEQDKSFFNDLLNQKPIVTDINRNEKKKAASGRISQKERKRLSREAAEVKEESPSPTKPSSWSGWGSVTPANNPSQSSLVDIMRLETKSPPQQEKPKLNKSEKRTSWKKIDLSSSIEAQTSSPSPVKMNPWKLPSPTSPIKEDLSKDRNAEIKTSVDTFQQIMKEDVKKEENLQKVQSKPLHVTQIEEKAIEELKRFYNIENCKDEIITIARLEKGCIATPVWKKSKK